MFLSPFATSHQPCLGLWPLVLRNVLVHGYFGIDLDQVWSTAVRDLPALKGEINRLLQLLPPA